MNITNSTNINPNIDNSCLTTTDLMYASLFTFGLNIITHFGVEFIKTKLNFYPRNINRNDLLDILTQHFNIGVGFENPMLDTNNA
jgi:hypothetical protein